MRTILERLNVCRVGQRQSTIATHNVHNSLLVTKVTEIDSDAGCRGFFVGPEILAGPASASDVGDSLLGNNQHLNARPRLSLR
jgi:hypothetical protein